MELFILQDWFLYATFSLAISLVSVSPELYAYYKNKEAWLPVNLPPYMIGDDYHYFTLLNFIHRRFLNYFYGFSLEYPPLTVNSRFQLFGFLFNLIPYHVGYLLVDRRFGVLLVRLWNRFLLGISFYFLYGVISTATGNQSPHLLEIIASLLVFLMLYPGPLNIGIRSSIFFNFYKKDHIYKQSNSNDLFRAMFSETTAPIFLASVAFLIHVNELRTIPESSISTIIFLVGVLFFHYPPASIVFSAAVFLLGILKSNIVIPSLSLAVTACLLISYMYFLRKDHVGRELFVHDDSGKILNLGFRNVIFVLCTILPSSSIGLLLAIFVDLFMGLAIFIFGIFSIGRLLKKHQLSRFFDRGSAIPLQAVAIILIFQYDVFKFADHYSLALIFFAMLLWYFLVQSVFLFSKFSTTLDRVTFEKIRLNNIFLKTDKSRVIATDSPVVGGLIDLFSSHTSLLRNYSVQPYGYLNHIDSICLNFKLLNYSFERFKDIACARVEGSDWLSFRSLSDNNNAIDACYRYSIQFIATYKDFNQKIIDDENYTKSGAWTKKFETLLSQKYEICDVKLRDSSVTVIALHS